MSETNTAATEAATAPAPERDAAAPPAQETANNQAAEGGDPASGEGEPAKSETGEERERRIHGPQWYQNRVARYVKGMREAEAAAAEERTIRQRYETELAVLRGSQQPATGNPVTGQPAAPARSEAQIREEAIAQVRAEAEHRSFNEKCTTFAQQAAAAIPEFNHAIRGMQDAGLDLSKSGHRELVDLITSLPDGAEIYHKIGTDPELADKILSLSPVRAAYEIRGLSASTPGNASPAVQAIADRAPAAIPGREVPGISQAPRLPGSPAGPRGTAPSGRTIYDTKELSMDDWVKLRTKK